MKRLLWGPVLGDSVAKSTFLSKMLQGGERKRPQIKVSFDRTAQYNFTLGAHLLIYKT